MSDRIRTVTVLGAGVMGSGIAAHLAGAGLDVLLLDIVPPAGVPNPTGDRNLFARGGLDKALKSKPAAFFSPRDAERVRIGNLEDDLAAAGKTDLIIEAVKEELDVKRALFAQLEPHVQAHTIVASNTSGLPIAQMNAGRSGGWKKNFLVMHFFNPVRYMKLLELVSGPDTAPAVTQKIARFSEDVLGKGVVFGKDTPNFVANRIGVFGMMYLLRVATEMGLTVEEVDAIFGAPMGRPKSAVFRTADMVGLDTLTHVAQNCAANLPDDEQRAVFQLPAFLEEMVKKKLLGDKTGGGFYKKTPDGILALDLKTLEYRPQAKARFASLGTAKNLPDVDAKVRAVLAGSDKASEIAWKTTAATLAYASHRLAVNEAAIADDVVQIDRGMRWGFAWERGPFETWDALGVAATVERMEKDGFHPAQWVKDMLASGRSSFYETFYAGGPAAPTYWDQSAKTSHAVPASERAISLDGLRASGKQVDKNDGASILDLGDGVFCLELHTKMNALDGDVIAMVDKAIARVSKEGVGLVVGNQSSEAFSAGANIFMILVAAGQKDWATIDRAAKELQDGFMGLRYAPFPVVTAPFGLTLGGGCELAMHGDAARAHAELYMGLVEAGVGLIPAGGGCKEMLARTLGHLADAVDPFPFIQQLFMTIAMGKVSMSAEEARGYGFLRENDAVTMNKDYLIYDAKQTALGLARAGYRAPRLRTFKLPGESGYATIRSALQQMKAAHQVSDHDVVVGSKLAWVLCGGRCSPTVRQTEQYVLDLEREAFTSLVGEPKSQERMQHMLMNGKPLRN